MPFAVTVVAVLGFILIRAIVAGREAAEVASWLSLFSVGVVVTINYLWFHYVAINTERILQVNYLGLLRKTVPIGDLKCVGTRPVEAAYGLMRPTQSVRFCSSHGVIELARAYDEGPLRDAIKLLKNKGVPVDAKLLKWLKIE